MDLISIISFFGFTFLVAFVSWWKTKDYEQDSSDGYFLGGRSLTGGVIAGSLMLTNLSTEQLIGLNGVSFSEGLVAIAWETLASISLVLLALFFLPRYLKSGLTTVPEFLEDRFDRTTRTMTTCLFLMGYVFILLPIVLYSGSLGLIGIFNLDQLFGLTHAEAIWCGVWAIGLVGSIYAIFGGLRAVAISDTVNGIGLLIGGIALPLFGLSFIGDGSVFEGFAILRDSHPERFSAVGRDDQSVPFSTLFTGMILVNTFYWCTNQAIVQRALAAKNLAEGQKGALLAGFLKLLGPLILVLPGMIAFHIFGNDIETGDLAYPMLVQKVLPSHWVGFFAAVMAGAILSSFNSALNSAVTLFSVGIFKRHIRPQSSDKQLVKVGQIFGAVLAVVSMLVAPFIMYAPQGLFGYLQMVNGCYSIPILTIILVGMFTKKVPAFAAKVALVFGVVTYFISQFVWKVDLHYLHVMAILFVISTALMLVIGYFKPMAVAYEQKYTEQVDITPWPYAKFAGLLIVSAAVATYVVFS